MGQLIDELVEGGRTVAHTDAGSVVDRVGGYTGACTDVMVKALDAEWPGPLPHTVLIAPGGKILYRRTGSIDPNELRDVAIEAMGRYYTPTEGK